MKKKMKKIVQSLLMTLLFAVLFAYSNINAQVTVSGSTSGNGSYSTLKAAFDALNLEENQSGNAITITLNASTYLANSETTTCMLEEPAVSNWASFNITPIGAVTISGAIPAGIPLIDFNGADFVIINGLNSSGNSLTISNTTVSATSGTSTIRFQADASNNTVTNCSVLGSSTMSASTSGGNIWFGAAAIARGNDINTISNCNIGPAGLNLPSKGVYSSGTTTTLTTFNNGNIISGCNIFDYFSPSVTSAGIYIANGSTEFTITNNKFYQTATRTQTTGSVHAGIQLAGSGINSCTISGNTIGFSSSAGTGFYDFVGVSSSSKFYPVYSSSHGALAPSSIQGNTIKNIKISGFVSGVLNTPAFAGIFFSSGIAEIGNITGNIIGSSASPASIDYTSTGTSIGELYGICYSPVQPTCNISNNSIGGIKGTNTSAGGLKIYGIRARINSAGENIIVNNTVGYSAAPIDNNDGTNTSSIVGISAETGKSNVTGNTVEYLNCVAPNVGQGSSSSVIGIFSSNSGSSVGNIISQNTVRALKNSNATDAVWISGIVYNGSTIGSHEVSKNKVMSLNITSSSEFATMNGIYIVGGLTTYKNNFVSLGSDILGNDITNNISINGISEIVAGTDNIYFNSVVVCGSGITTGNANTYALNSAITFNTREYRDNIFYNARSNNTGTGSHYAVKVGGSGPNPAGLSINNNVYYVSGTGGVFGYYNSLPVTGLNAWQANVGSDANSLFGNPQFINYKNNFKISLAVNSIANNNGVSIAGISDDIEGTVRSLTKPDIGCDEFTGAYVLNLTAASQLCPSGIYTIALYNLSMAQVGSTTGTITDAATNLTLVYNNIADLTGGYFSITGVNTLKVWSNFNNITPSDASAINYNMTTSQTQEFSGNLLFNANSVWSIPGGDVNQDETIDAFDLASVENDVVCGTPGCISGFPTDINCDGNNVDASDLSSVENNQGLYVTNP